MTKLSKLELHPDVKAFKEFAEKHPKLIRSVRSGEHDLKYYFKHYQKYGEADSFWDQFRDEAKESESKASQDKKKKWSDQLKNLLDKIELDNIDQHLKQADSAITELKKLITHFSEIKASAAQNQVQTPHIPQPPQFPPGGMNRRFF